MWCNKCQKVVLPAASPHGDEGIRCLLCGANLEAPGPTTPELNDFSASLSAIPLDWDHWELDEDLRLAERLGHAVEPTLHNAVAMLSEELSPPTPAGTDPGQPPKREPDSDKPGLGVACARVVLPIAFMAFVGGAALLVWSSASGRVELQRWGMPLTLAGQTALLIGLLVHLGGHWQARRRAAQELAEMRQRLDCLERAGNSMDSLRPYADGATMTLTEWKSQLNRLAMHLNRRAA